MTRALAISAVQQFFDAGGFRETLARVNVSELVTPSVISVPATLTIESAVKGYFLPHGFSGFPVMEQDRLVGMVTVQDLQRIPQTLWPWREVRDVMRPWITEMEISAGASALHALEQMGMAGLDRLIVRQEGRIVGVLTRHPRPVVRTVARIDMPSTRQPMTCARFAVLSLFILTIMLDRSSYCQYGGIIFRGTVRQ